MSPRDFYGVSAFVRLVNYDGFADFIDFVVYEIGVRPVLNLKSGSLKSGSGTASDPYLV